MFLGLSKVKDNTFIQVEFVFSATLILNTMLLLYIFLISATIVIKIITDSYEHKLKAVTEDQEPSPHCLHDYIVLPLLF